MNNDIVYQPLLTDRLSKYGVCLITTALLAFPFVAQAASAPQDTFEVKQEMVFGAYDAVHWQTPVTTYNGSIYFVWVDNLLRTMIAKKTPDGKVATNVILEKSDPDNNHSLTSVAIDKKGYIHVAYNMHQSMNNSNVPGETGWQYKVSDKPEDISSFTFVGNSERTIPGQKITYPSFTKDNNGALYVTFRHRTHPEGNFQVDGSQGIGIARYDVNSQRWTMLGGTDYKYGVKTFFWSDSSARTDGGKSVGYQGYRAKIVFGRNNRMHVSWNVFVEPGDGASHIMYAYSDDDGATFKKADGQKISSLPITPQNGDIVAQASRGIYATRAYVGVMADGNPTVSFDLKDERKVYYSTWDGKKWTTPRELPAASPGDFVIDSNGVITAVGNGEFNRSVDNGETWKSYKMNSSAESTAFDDEYLKQTNELRFQTQLGDTVKVFTARFATDDGCCSPPSPPTGLTVGTRKN